MDERRSADEGVMPDAGAQGPAAAPQANGVLLTAASHAQMEQFRSAHATEVLTILISDLAGSTQLQSAAGNLRAAKLVQTHRAVFRQVLAGVDGREVETAGDSFLVVFATPSDGVKFALLMQSAMRQARREEPDLPAVRVGLHQGQVVVERHGTGAKPLDIYGLQVSTAARIADLAGGGQVLCSRAVFDDARAILRAEDLAGLSAIGWLNHGPYRFKGVADAYEVCEVGEEGAAPLVAPASTTKSWRADQPDEELGWRPAVGVTAPGTNWQLQERLGRQEGGAKDDPKYRGEFGEVWRAWNRSDQSQEVFKFCFKRDRVPALKREARLLKQLRQHRHPNLVEVYDVTVGDRPPYYLEMEYVPGPSLEEWLAANPPLEARLEIIAQVADALDVVHAAGIYHRDIKPSNILLTHRQDGALQAKLSDFGLGAADDKRLLQSIEVSRVEPVAGTWDYIAPELRGGGKASAQSDIYSLGLTLFQLATGNLKSPAGPGWEGQVPSEVLRGDIARCMDPAAEKRWRQAGELARALRSHGERVERLRLEREHTAQRRRARRLKAISAVVGLFAVVTLGLGGLAWQQRNVAKFQRGEAQQQRNIADEQRGRAVADERIATSQRDRAEQLFAAGKNFADFAIFDLEQKLENLAGSTVARKLLVDRALAYLESLLANAAGDAALLRSVSAAYRAIGDVQGNPFGPNVGDVQGALASYRKGLAIRQRLADAEPTSAQARRDLLVSLNGVGDILAQTNDLTGALASYRQGLDIAQRRADADQADALAQADLSGSLERIGKVLAQGGDLTNSLAIYRKGLPIAQRLADADRNNADAQRNVSVCLDDIGDALTQANDLPGALASYRRSLDIRQRLADAAPANILAQQDLAAALSRIGNLLWRTEDTPGALDSYGKCLATRQRLADADKTDAQAQGDLSACLAAIAMVQFSAGDAHGAMDRFNKAIKIAEALVKLDPNDPKAKARLASIQTLFASCAPSYGAASRPADGLTTQPASP